ncbi:MAG: TIGR04283 family arsenosugar biosynthesis glycosyltransferase [Candidatus Methanoperedens sp.]|nr:TIGR04283 family arsenosugar biosynthesis glycosyltransferase [Candidatus Methanoperedens sp.]
MVLISIITPVFNEERNINPFLTHIGSLEGDFELILVDGESSDRTLDEAEGCRNGFGRMLKILKTSRGRAIQMNKGAKVAKGDILLFLHVDCTLEKNALKLIEKAIYEKKAIGGGFMQEFSSPDLFLKLGSAFGNFRVSLNRIFYGDYGIFLKKEIFWKIGGYDEIPYLEDVELCKKAKKQGQLIQIHSRIVTSPRRYLKKGKLKLAAAFMFANLFNTVGWRPGFLWNYIVDM